MANPMDHLTSEQNHALVQLQSITNGADDEVAVGVLQSVDWDVQRATEMIFGSGPIQSPSYAHTQMEPLEVDDSQQARRDDDDSPGAMRGRRAPRARYFLGFRPSVLLSIFSYPFHVLVNVFRFIFEVLRVSFPRFGTLRFPRSYPPGGTGGSGRGTVERWVRELEEETGALCVSRSRDGARYALSSSGAEPGPSGSTTKMRDGGDRGSDEGQKCLPDFYTGTYESFLRLCQKEAKIGCVVLVSEEHDDVAEFKRTTLTDSTLVMLLHQNEILVWGGDVRDSEAWSASQKLQSTTYPFVAFVALQPRIPLHGAATQHVAANNSTLTVLSRHAGPSTPASTGPTSATTLASHITTQILPRVQPFLSRMRSLERERRRDRSLREQQDQAFQESARKDRERIAERMRAEKDAEETRRLREAVDREEEAKRVSERAVLARWREERMAWRRWGRRVLVGPEAHANAEGGIRIAVTLPRHGRVIRRFGTGATLTEFFAYVDSLMIPAELGREDDPVASPNGATDAPHAVVEELVHGAGAPEKWWGFKVLLAYPRKEIEWNPRVRLGDVEGLSGGGQVVVEASTGSSWVDDKDGSGDESDG